MSIDRRAAVFAALLSVLALGFAALGVWQIERLQWKLRLIATVNARVTQAPEPAPGPADWPQVSFDHDAYRRIRIDGRYLNDKAVLVQALTEQGAGFWVLTPLQTDRQFVVIVNRGFVPTDRSDPATLQKIAVTGPVAVTGLLRLSEPHGRFLEANQPAQNLWYSRDVEALAEHERLGVHAPYFIDAEAAADANALPVGGLTVIHFANSHLIYVLTWFGLCGLSLFGVFWVLRGDRGREA